MKRPILLILTGVLAAITIILASRIHSRHQARAAIAEIFPSDPTGARRAALEARVAEAEARALLLESQLARTPTDTTLQAQLAHARQALATAQANLAALPPD